MSGMKKKQHGAILSCDPSFKGCAFVLWYKARQYQNAIVYDIRCERKQYDSFLVQVQLVSNLLDELFKDFNPFIFDCTAFVIEGQYKSKMKCLLHCIVNQLYVMLPELKVFVVSAITWRPFFNLNFPHSTYAERKKASVHYVKRNPQLICSGLWINDDNICEAILLLNYIVDKHRLHISSEEMPVRLWLGETFHDFTDKEIKKDCPDCKGSVSIRIAGPSSASKGQPYFHCKACQTSRGKGHKGPVNNKKWQALIKAAQKEANNYMLDDEDDEENQDDSFQCSQPQKPKRGPSQQCGSNTQNKQTLPDDSSIIMSLRLIQKDLEFIKSRMDFLEKVVSFSTSGSLVGSKRQRTTASCAPESIPVTQQRFSTNERLFAAKNNTRYVNTEDDNAGDNSADENEGISSFYSNGDADN